MSISEQDIKQIESIVEEKLKKLLSEKKKRMAIIASKGTLDMAYPPLILATTAAAMDIECSIFFTFYGLDIINRHKNKHLQVPSLANPAMPVPMPNIIGALPGMTAMATMMMKSWMAKVNVPSITDLLSIANETGVKLIGCQMTMDVMGTKKEDLIDGVEVAGAAAFMEYASEADITLFV